MPAILPIAAEHVDGFQAALDAVARERRFLTFLEAPPLESTRRLVLEGIAGNVPHFVALAGDGTVVGWCDVWRDGRPAHAHRGTLGMGILREFRGRGLGRRLIETTLSAAFDRGLTRVELSVHADNEPAVALYEKVGFAREGLIRDAFLADGTYRDAIMMAIVRR